MNDVTICDDRYHGLDLLRSLARRCLALDSPVPAPCSGVFFALGVTHALVKNSTALVRWLVELSYPVYLLHLLPAMVISAMLIGAGFGQLPVVAMTIILTFIISVISYYVLIKFTPISWVVNGYRKSWLPLAFLRGR